MKSAKFRLKYHINSLIINELKKNSKSPTRKNLVNNFTVKNLDNKMFSMKNYKNDRISTPDNLNRLSFINQKLEQVMKDSVTSFEKFDRQSKQDQNKKNQTIKNIKNDYKDNINNKFDTIKEKLQKIEITHKRQNEIQQFGTKFNNKQPDFKQKNLNYFEQLNQRIQKSKNNQNKQAYNHVQNKEKSKLLTFEKDYEQLNQIILKSKNHEKPEEKSKFETNNNGIEKYVDLFKEMIKIVIHQTTETDNQKKIYSSVNLPNLGKSVEQYEKFQKYEKYEIQEDQSVDVQDQTYENILKDQFYLIDYLIDMLKQNR